MTSRLSTNTGGTAAEKGKIGQHRTNQIYAKANSHSNGVASDTPSPASISSIPSSSSSSSAKSVLTSLLSVESEDLVHRCLSYLTLRELIPLTTVCQRSLLALRLEPCRNITFSQNSAMLLSLCSSVLRRHVVKLIIPRDFRKKPNTLLPEEIKIMKQHLPSLANVEDASVDAPLVDMYFAANMREILRLPVSTETDAQMIQALRQNWQRGASINVSPIHSPLPTAKFATSKPAENSSSVAPQAAISDPAEKKANATVSTVAEETQTASGTIDVIGRMKLPTESDAGDDEKSPDEEVAETDEKKQADEENEGEENDEEAENEEPSVILNDSLSRTELTIAEEDENGPRRSDADESEESTVIRDEFAGGRSRGSTESGMNHSNSISISSNSTIFSPLATPGPSPKSSPIPLTLVLLGARHLRPDVPSALVDPYVSVTALWNGRKWKSRVEKHTASPVWNQKFTMDIPSACLTSMSRAMMNDPRSSESNLLSSAVSSYGKVRQPSESTLNSNPKGTMITPFQHANSSSLMSAAVSRANSTSVLTGGGPPSNTVPLPMPSPSSTKYLLRLRVYHKELFSKLFLGEVILSMHQLLKLAECKQDVWRALHDKADKPVPSTPFDGMNGSHLLLSEAMGKLGDVHFIVTIDPAALQASSAAAHAHVLPTSGSNSLNSKSSLQHFGSSDSTMDSPLRSTSRPGFGGPPVYERRRSRSQELSSSALAANKLALIEGDEGETTSPPTRTRGISNNPATVFPPTIRSPNSRSASPRRSLSVDFSPANAANRKNSNLATVLAGGTPDTSAPSTPGGDLNLSGASESSVVRHSNFVYPVNGTSPALGPKSLVKYASSGSAVGGTPTRARGSSSARVIGVSGDSDATLPPPRFELDSIDKIARLTAELEDSRRHAQNALEKQQVAESARVTAETESKELRSKITDLEDQLRGARLAASTAATASSTSTAFEVALKDSERKNANLSLELKALQGVLSNTKMTAANEMDQLKSKLMQAASESAAFAAYKKSTASYVASLQNEQAQAALEIRSLVDRIHILETSLRVTEERMASTRTRGKNRILFLLDRVDKLETNLAHKDQALSEQLATNKALQEKCESNEESYRESIDELRDKLEQTSRLHHTADSFASRSVWKSSLEVLQLMRATSLANTSLTQLHEKRLDEQRKLDLILEEKARIDRLQSEHEALTQQVSSQQSAMEEMQRVHHSLVQMMQNELNLARSDSNALAAATGAPLWTASLPLQKSRSASSAESISASSDSHMSDDQATKDSALPSPSSASAPAAGLFEFEGKGSLYPPPMLAVSTSSPIVPSRGVSSNSGISWSQLSLALISPEGQ